MGGLLSFYLSIQLMNSLLQQILIKGHQVILFSAPSSIIWGRLLGLSEVSTQRFFHTKVSFHRAGMGWGKFLQAMKDG